MMTLTEENLYSLWSILRRSSLVHLLPPSVQAIFEDFESEFHMVSKELKNQWFDSLKDIHFEIDEFKKELPEMQKQSESYLKSRIRQVSALIIEDEIFHACMRRSGFPSWFRLLWQSAEPKNATLEQMSLKSKYKLLHSLGKRYFKPDSSEFRLRVSRAANYSFKELLGYKKYHLCPFHSEKTPSFHIWKDNFAFCFGCGWRGNPIKYLMDKENLTFKEAVYRLS